MHRLWKFGQLHYILGRMREPFFGRNARPFIIQFVAILALTLFAGPHIRYWIGEGLCSGLGFCSTAQQQRASD